MEIKDKIVIATQFSSTPGARYRKDGEFSGEEFLEVFLLPKFEKAVKEGYILEIDLDKVWGYPSSFVSGSFGKLSVAKGADLVLKHLKFVSEENPIRLEKILAEIKNPRNK
ncbi:MAG: STAS-like domain-containing protein [Saprospiraceae bacterium]|nr:STAS-like domain-containing protein [Saprospiraceae bacterium]